MPEMPASSYGLAWTPSALEQRTGRIDRVRSQTERRIVGLGRKPSGEDKLQVHYPYLAETVERLQVRRVLRRMDDFIRLMHTDLALPHAGEGRIDIALEVLDDDGSMPQPPEGVLRSAFEVRPADLRGDDVPLAVDAATSEAQLRRFGALAQADLGGLALAWDGERPSAAVLLGTRTLDSGRVQPFNLQLPLGQRAPRCPLREPCRPVGRRRRP